MNSMGLQRWLLVSLGCVRLIGAVSLMAFEMGELQAPRMIFKKGTLTVP